jgi:hypothetical protein
LETVRVTFDVPAGKRVLEATPGVRVTFAFVAVAPMLDPEPEALQ